MQLIHTASSKYLEYGRGRVLQLIQLLQSADDVVELGIRTAANPLMSVIDKDPNSFTSALSGSRGFKQAPRDVVNSRHAQLVHELPHLELQQLLLFLLHTADSQQLVLPTVLPTPLPTVLPTPLPTPHASRSNTVRLSTSAAKQQEMVGAMQGRQDVLQGAWSYWGG